MASGDTTTKLRESTVALRDAFRGLSVTLREATAAMVRLNELTDAKLKRMREDARNGKQH